MNVTPVIKSWRLKINVVDFSANRTRPTASQAFLQYFKRHLNQDPFDGFSLLLGELFEHLSLYRSTGKTIKYIPVLAVITGSALPYHRDDHVIGNQLSGSLCGVDVLSSERPQHIAG